MFIKEKNQKEFQLKHIRAMEYFYVMIIEKSQHIFSKNKTKKHKFQKKLRMVQLHRDQACSQYTREKFSSQNNP